MPSTPSIIRFSLTCLVHESQVDKSPGILYVSLEWPLVDNGPTGLYRP